MDVAELVLVALAVWEIVEIWRHGSLFARWRAQLEDRRDGWLGRRWLILRQLRGGKHALLRATLARYQANVWAWLAELLLCGFCLTPWIALSVVCLLPYAPVPFYALAAARLANLGNDLSHAVCRTPRDSAYVPPLEEES